MIKGYIFDYGGTLDTSGRHWGKVLWQAYMRHDVKITERQFREAYVHVERTLGSHRIIMPDFTFRNTLDAKLRIELEYLAANRYLSLDETELQRLHDVILDDVYAGVKDETARSRKTLDMISRKYPMVLVSNFYGNVNVVLKEFGFDALFKSVVESAVVGIRKPDPRIFTLGVEALGMQACETVVVGDSFDKDIIPAKKAGCHTVWFKGEGWTEETHDESIPDAIITELSQLTSVDFR